MRRGTGNVFKAIAMIQQRLHKGYRNINTVNSAIGKNFIKNRCPVLFRYWTEYAGSIWKSSDIYSCFVVSCTMPLLKNAFGDQFTP